MAGFDPNAYLAEGSSGGFDPQAYLSEGGPQAPSTLGDYGRAALGGIQSGLRTVDSYTGAPVRAAIGALQNDVTSPGAAVQAYRNQFGADPSKAPTGQDIVEKAGIPAGSTAAKVAGFGMDVATNPTTFIPIGDIVGGAAKGIGGALGMGADAAADAAPDVAAAVKPGMGAKFTGTAAETLTGVDKKLAANYAANTDRINGIISQYAGPDGYQEAEHAADIRSGWRSAIQGTRQQMNGQISAALSTPEAAKATIDATPIADGVQSAIDKAHPVTQTQDIATLADLQSKLGQMTNADGNISLKDLQAFKQYAAGVAQPAYDGVGNAIFPGGQFAASQAKGIAGSARSILIDNAPQSVSDAEATLAKLHNAEDTMNSTILKDNGPVQAISRAAANPGGSEARSLGQLAAITGHDFAQDAQDFATARQFASPGFTPMDSTGKSVARQLISRGIGGGAGGAFGYMVGGPGGAWVGSSTGAAVAGTVMSPAAVKLGINAANAAGNAIGAVTDAAGSIPRAAYSAATSPMGQRALDIGAKAALAQPAASVASAVPAINRTPARGPDAWAQQGLQGLGIQDPGLSQRLLQDPKAKQLLIQASDLKPGSNAMNQIMTQIKAKWGTQ